MSQSHFLPVTTNNISYNMHYLTHGDATKPPVLCVHGLTCLGHDFDYLAKALADDFYIIAPDMPGRGQSDYLPDAESYSNELYLHGCLALLQHLGITSVHWVGASMGGILGMMACASQPEIVRSLMLCDVGKVLAKEGLKEIFLYVGKESVAEDNAAFEAQLREAYAEFNFTKEAHWRHFFTHRTVKDVQGTLHLRCDPKVIKPLRAQAKALDEVEDVSLQPLWDVVQCPVLLFRGEKSELLRADAATSMVDDKPDVTLHTWPHVGHMPNLYEEAQITVLHDWLLQQV